MTHDPYTITPTSPAREIEGLRHRIERTEQALREGRGSREANERELQLLKHLAQRWRREQEELRASWREYHHRQFRAHQLLAKGHYTAMMELVKGEVMPAELDQPSSNGSH